MALRSLGKLDRTEPIGISVFQTNSGNTLKPIGEIPTTTCQWAQSTERFLCLYACSDWAKCVHSKQTEKHLPLSFHVLYWLKDPGTDTKALTTCMHRHTRFHMSTLSCIEKRLWMMRG